MHTAFTEAFRGDCVLGVMKPSIEQVVRRIFCVIMHTVEMARSLSLEPVDGSVDVQAHKEAAYRHQWDQLIHAVVLCCAQADVGYE